jgi:hypothetical protein
MYQFEHQFRKENPQTIGETDSHFDLDNYKDWLEAKLFLSNKALESLVFSLKEYATGNSATQEYFSDEINEAQKAFVYPNEL